MITARVGNEPGRSFRLKAKGAIVQKGRVNPSDLRANVLDIEVPAFTQAVLAFGGKTSLRTFVLEPGVESDEFVFGSFFIRGTYRVVEKINNPAEASRRFKEFA